MPMCWNLEMEGAVTIPPGRAEPRAAIAEKMRICLVDMEENVDPGPRSLRRAVCFTWWPAHL